MNILQLVTVQIHFLAFIVYLGLIGFVLHKNPKAFLNRLCALALAPFAIWSLGFAFSHGAPSANEAMLWINVASLGWCSFPIFTLWFYLAFTKHQKVLKNRLFIAICILLASSFIYLQWTGSLINDLVRQSYGWFTIWASSMPTYFFFAYYFLFISACIPLALDFGRKTRSLREKKQARLLAITPIVVLVLGSLTDIILPELGIQAVPPIAIIFILIWGGGLVYAITRYGLMALTPTSAAEDILATMGDSLMMVDLKGKIILANKATSDLLGYKADDLVDKPFNSILIKSTNGEDASWQEILEKGKISSRDATYLARKGKSIPVLISASVVKDREGEPAGVVVTAHDMTEYKKIELNLRQSEERYRTLFQSSPDLIALVDGKGKFITANPAMAGSFGISQEEMVGKTFFELMPEVVARHRLEMVRKALDEGRIQVFDDERDGKWLSNIFVPIILPGKGEATVQIIARDITERRLAEQEYRQLLNAMNETLWIINFEGKFIEVNDAAVNKLGYSRDELLTMGPKDIDPHLSAVEIGELIEGMKSDKLQRFETEHRAREGKIIPVDINSTPVTYHGEAAIMSIAHDMTEYKKIELNLRQSEERYRTLVDHALVGIGIHQNDRIVFANKELAAMLGYTLEEGIGLSIYERIHPDERNFVIARAQRRQEGSKEPETYEIRLLKKDGSTLYALISNAVMDYQGQPATLMTIADITDSRMRVELEQANKELEAFSYSVSHDLRAPLRSIDGFSQALLEDYGDSFDETGKDYLHRVRAASQHMAQLIDDLLKLSRVNRAEMRYESVDLSDMIKAIAKELRDKEPERIAEFIIAEGVMVQGDASLLRVALENLLNNAWKFTGKHPLATIEFGVSQREGQPVYFVRDDGAGFDMAYVDRLFVPFQRLHTSAEFEGTGIGLATVQRIIHRHSGSIWAKGEVEKGATFYFTLKL